MQVGEDYKTSLERADKIKGSVNDTFLALTNCEVNTVEDRAVFMLDASILVKKSVVETIGFENKKEKFFWREETDFQISCGEKGLKLVFCPHTASFHLPKNKDKGGTRTGSILKYNWQIVLNNWYFLHKHKEFLEKRMGMGSIYLSFVGFLYNRIWTKHLLLYVVKVKKALLP
jgi:GT2 family glycosyltransferase